MRRRKIWMAKTTPPSQKEIDAIKDHLTATAGVMVKCYTLRQLAFLDWVTPATVRHSWKYMPVRFDNRMSRADYFRWKFKRPYAVKWIRVDEIKYIYNRRNKRHKLVEEPI